MPPTAHRGRKHDVFGGACSTKPLDRAKNHLGLGQVPGTASSSRLFVSRIRRPMPLESCTMIGRLCASRPRPNFRGFADVVLRGVDVALRRSKRAPRQRQTGQESPKTAKEAPKKHPNAPSRPKEAPKRPPRGLQEAPSRPQECPKRLQEASFSSSYSYYCSSYSSSSSCSFSPTCSPKAFRTDSGNTWPIAWQTSDHNVRQHRRFQKYRGPPPPTIPLLRPRQFPLALPLPLILLHVHPSSRVLRSAAPC